MSQKSGTPKMSSERIAKDIRRATRKQYSAEKKIRIVLDGLRGEHSIAELCRREGIAESLYYIWSKEFGERILSCPSPIAIIGPLRLDELELAARERAPVAACRIFRNRSAGGTRDQMVRNISRPLRARRTASRRMSGVGCLTLTFLTPPGDECGMHA